MASVRGGGQVGDIEAEGLIAGRVDRIRDGENVAGGVIREVKGLNRQGLLARQAVVVIEDAIGLEPIVK